MRVARWIGGGLVLAGLVAAVGYGGRRGCEPGPSEPAVEAAPVVPVERAAGWVRAVAAEPDPAARGLYRRAIDLAHAGDTAGSAAAVEQLRAQYADTRFGARVAREGDPRAAVALLGSAAAVLVTVLASDAVDGSGPGRTGASNAGGPNAGGPNADAPNAAAPNAAAPNAGATPAPLAPAPGFPPPGQPSSGP